MSSEKVSIYHVDDYVQSRALLEIWIRSAPGLRYLGGTDLLKSGLAECRRLRPNLIILDVVLPDGDSLDFLDQFNALPGAPKLVLHTAWKSDAFLARSQSAQVHGILWKSGRREELLKAIASVTAGQPYFSPAYFEQLQQLRGSEAAVNKQLSELEMSLLRLEGRGLSDTEICRQRGFSQATLDTHRRNIRRNLGIHDPKEMRSWVRDHGFNFMG